MTGDAGRGTAGQGGARDDPVAGIRRSLEGGRFRAAAAEAQRLLDTDLEAEQRVDVLYLQAVANRYAGAYREAARALDELLALAPELPRAHQERGHLLRVEGRNAAAVTAFERATAADPALLGSWRALVALHDAAGNAAGRNAAADRVGQLSVLPPALLAATNLLNENRLLAADEACRAFLAERRTHVDGMRLLAEIATRLRVYDEAEFLLETCLELEPGHVDARAQYLDLLLRRTRFEPALAQARRLLEIDGANPGFRSSLAAALAGLGRFDEAIEAYRAVLAHEPRRSRIHVMIGHAEKSAGRIDAAVESYRRAAALRPEHGDAYWSLANTKTYRFDAHEIRQMQRQEAAGSIGRDDRIPLCFALGKAMEDAGDVAAAFEYYARGNRLKREQVGYRDGIVQQRVAAQIESCTPQLFQRHPGAGCPAADPIFIVGLPRAGSTLLEQILATHSQVDGTMELHDVLGLVQRLRGAAQRRGSRYPQVLHDLDPDLLRRFGEKYLADTRVHRGGAPLFVDKMPNNFMHVGLIRLILPNARVIDARRHPLACCFSNFKQLFGEGQEFTYGLHEVGSYYRAYVRLMDHWDAVLPGFVLRVMHEDVVADLEGQVRRLLDFCGLPFEGRCLEFHRTARSVRTPSSEQVRRPIYRDGMEQWRRFDAFLGPLREALGAGILGRYPPSPDMGAVRALSQRE